MSRVLLALVAALALNAPAIAQNAKQMVEPPRDLRKQVAELECEVRHLAVLKGGADSIVRVTEHYIEVQKQSKGDPKEIAEQLLELKQARKEAEEAAKKLTTATDALAKLKAKAMKLTRGYLELTVTGAANDYRFELKEVDATGNPLGTVTVRDTNQNTAQLTRLLARTKADPTAPVELRVIVQPQTALGNGPRAALAACAAAGYDRVTFTGYIATGHFPLDLKPDYTRRAFGYDHYDADVQKPSELLKEIDEGIRNRY